MKKLLIPIIFIAALSQSSFAQTKLGLRFSNSFSTANPASTILKDGDNNLAYQLNFVSQNSSQSFGLTSYSDIGNLFFMADALYRKTQNNFMLNTYSEGQSNEYEIHEIRHTLHIPVSAGVKFGMVKLGVGPIFNLPMDIESELNNFEGFAKVESRMSMGAQYFVGVNLKNHIHIDLKYENSYSNVSDNYNYELRSDKIRMSPNRITLSFGLFL